MKTRPQKGRARVAASDPRWEAAKAARRHLDHNAAVQECVFLQKQFDALWSPRMVSSPIDLNLILRTLTEKKIRFVLTGAHGIGGWTGRPRSTKDVDILVSGGRNQARAVKVLRTLYPELEVRDFAGVTAFFAPGDTQSVMDVTYPRRPDLAETLKNPTWTTNREGLRYRVPSLEEALANKYGAMLTPNRALVKRQQDLVDFGWMVQHSTDEDQKTINLQRLEVLGEMVWPGGGGAEILTMVKKCMAGSAIDLNHLG